MPAMHHKLKFFASGLLIGGAMSFGLVGSAMAMATTQTVKGAVTQAGKPLTNLQVTVACNGATHLKLTDKSGVYSTTFSSNVCPLGQTVALSAHNGSASGVNSAVLQAGTNTINLQLVSASLPEFGMLAAVAAAGAGGWLILRARRKASQT